MNYVKNTIGWADWTSNAIKGLCPMSCPYCYAKAAYHRFGWDPKIRLDKKELLAPALPRFKKPARIFVGSTIEMYHSSVPYEYVSAVIAASWGAPRHTFITLTKLPGNLESIEFPEWWWVGTTINNFQDWIRLSLLRNAEASLKFISFEPLLDDLGDSTNIQLQGIDWIILGAQTNPYKPPQLKWIEKIIQKADAVSIPVFLKDNLFRAFPDLPRRQEFPNYDRRNFSNG